MTPEAQRIAIAEACGWKAVHREDKCDGVNLITCGACGAHGHANCYGDGRGALQFTCADSPCCEGAVSPNYLSDLNAMHEAEKTLPGFNELPLAQNRNSYHDHLFDVCGTITLSISATASQRAEAFLRTLGKWDDTR